MKNTAIIVATLLAGAAAYGQGTVNFANRSVGVFEAPVTYNGERIAGTAAWAQYYAGPAGGALTAIGAPVNFRSGANAGFTLAVPDTVVAGVAPGSQADVVLRVWHADLGVTSWEAAQALDLGGVGQSATVTVATGGAGTPPSLPAVLTGMTGFEVSQVIPEPSIAALGLLGAGLLLVRRKK
ncbi:MAG: PEP-CTERM sorting domain-containing protein [Verrucomicrobiae bacterium]|nr:PEP-CTERM sorting domain-containing protein [Verrucomicrobiae bacterium]